MVKAFLLLFSVCGVLMLSSCGGGGGDDGIFSGAGTVVLSLQPSSIDVGDRTQVTIQIFRVNEDGAIVKVNFPDALTYVGGTALLIIDGDETEVEPAHNLMGDDDDRFLVFFFEQDDFDRDAEGTLKFELQGNDSVDGEVGVDIDVDDPTIPNDSEFDISDPRYQAEDSDRIKVDK